MSKRVILYSGLVFLMVFSLYFSFIIYIYPDLLTQHEFQDLFAGISAFFSGLAFMGLVIAILLQREELSLQREELKLTRTELKRAATAQEKSEEALLKQADSLRITAKLNGLSALLQMHTSIRNEAITRGNTRSAHDSDRKAKEVAYQINEIISQK